MTYEQNEDEVKWRQAVAETGKTFQGHVIRSYRRDENYLCIDGMDISDLARYVSRFAREFRISDEVVRNMLRGFQKRTLVTQNYVEPYIVMGVDPRENRPAPRKNTISALEEYVGATKGDKAVFIAVELVRHNPDELVRRMVKESVEHKYTRPRKVVLGLTHKDQPYLFQTLQLEVRPDRVLSQPNTTHVDTVMKTALFSQTRSDEKAAFKLDAIRFGLAKE